MPAIGRNASCPCGSGRKYKHCCLDRDRADGSLRLVDAGGAGEWQVDLVPLSIAFENDHDARPGVVMIVADDRIMHHELVARAPAEIDAIAALLATAVAAAMPAHGEVPPIRVRHAAVAQALSRSLGRDISSGPLPTLDRAALGLQSHLAGHQRSQPTVSMPETWKGWGLPSASVSSLFTVAAAFFRAKPWRTFENADVLRFEWSPDSRWWLVVMGAGGEEFGLAMYQRREDIEALFAPNGSAPGYDVVTGMVVSLSFNHRDELPLVMQKEVLRHGWPVASTRAYPTLLTLNTPGGGVTTRQVDDLMLALRGVVHFASSLRKRKDWNGTMPAWHDLASGAVLTLDPVE